MGDAEPDSRTAALSRKRANDDDSASHSSSKRPRSPVSNTFSGWNRGVRSQIRPSLGRPRLMSSQSVPASTQTIPTAADKLEASGHAFKRSASPSTQLRGAGEASRARASVEPVVQTNLPATIEGESSSEEGEIRSAFSGDDEAVVINVANGEGHRSERGQGSGLESGEISDDQAPPGTAFDVVVDDESQDMDMSDGESAGSGRVKVSTGRGSGIEIIDLEDEEDPLMRYASGQPVQKLPPSAVNGKHASHATRDDMTLADLEYEDLRLQLRYYHVGRDPTRIPLTEPARCLSCAKAGHISAFCSALTCQHCSKYKDHFSEDCPKFSACSKCGQRGHTQQACSYKLQPTEEELRCELCGCQQHIGDDCESRWRTTRFPPATALPHLTVRLYCYECGDAGHLGNDCPSRPSFKGMGTSMWSRRTMPGGVVPAANQDHNRAPPPLSRRKQRALQDRQKRDSTQDDAGSLVGEGRVISARSRNPPIKMGNLAKTRSDLQADRKPAERGPAPKQPTPPPASTGGKKNKKKRKANSGQSVRPMPSAAKKAFVRGRT